MKELTNRYLSMVTECETIHDKFWSDYENSKVYLKELFQGEVIIEKEVRFEKHIQDIGNDILEKKLGEKIAAAIDPRVREFIESTHYIPKFQRRDEDRLTQNTRDFYFNVLTYNRTLAKQIITEPWNMYDVIKEKSLKIHANTKISKVLKHFITDEAALNEVQVLYSQILNDKMVKGTLCLSIHPMDYLTASVNKAGWTSCYNTMDPGAYCASTLCLVNSPNTVMAYLKADQDGEYSLGYNSDVITWNSKKWRTFASIGEEGEVVHIGRNYPYENMALNQEVANMISELTGKKYSKVSGSDASIVRIITPDNMYNDADCGDLYTCATERYHLGVPIYGRETIEIADSATCPHCGESFDDVEFGLLCCDCGTYDRCLDCGDILREGEMTWIESRGGYVCECCYDSSYSYCEGCNETMPYEDIVEYNYSYNSARDVMYQDYICKDCIEREGIVECVCCGDLTHPDLLREDGTCLRCQPLEQETVF